LPRITIRDVEHVLDFISNVDLVSEGFETERLRALRDRAFLLTLADTGLRVHEACELKRGDINWSSETAVIVKRGKKEIIRFTSRSMHALKEYLTLRAELDGASGKQLTALPLFARHDKGTGKKIKPITPTTGRNIVAQRVKQALGEDTEGHITPHSFRHYFVSTILRSSGNLKLAQTLARHENMQITQRYAHIDDDELDKGYYEIFEKRERSE
jgi:integrase